jgi:hypothetical protein
VWGVAPLSASTVDDGGLSPDTAPCAIASSRQLTASSRRPARVPHTSLCSPNRVGRQQYYPSFTQLAVQGAGQNINEASNQVVGGSNPSGRA